MPVLKSDPVSGTSRPAGGSDTVSLRPIGSSGAWLPWVVLALWIALPYIPMTIRFHGPVFVASILIDGFLIAIFCALKFGTNAASIDPERALVMARYRRFLCRIFLLIGLAILLPELILVTRALGERSQASWLPALSGFQDEIARHVSVFVPMMQRMPAALINEGFAERVGIVTGAYGVAYIGAAFVFVFVAVLLCGVAWAWRHLDKEVKARSMATLPRWRAISGFLCAPPAFFLMGYMALFHTGVSRLPKVYRKSKEAFPNFEIDDLDLVYRAITGLNGLAILLAGFLFLFLFGPYLVINSSDSD